MDTDKAHLVMGVRRRLMAFLAVLPWLRWSARANESVPTVPPEQYFKWNIEKAGTSIRQEFFITEYRFYQLLLQFRHTKFPLSAAEREEFERFTGDGSYRVYKNAPVNPTVVIPRTPAEVQRTFDLIRKGEYVTKPAHPGVIVPVRITIESFQEGAENGSSPAVIIDETIDTMAMIFSGSGGINRLIAGARLRPGKYRVTVVALRETKLPPNCETFFGISYRANSTVLKDNE